MSILPKATLNWMKIKKHQIFETATFFIYLILMGVSDKIRQVSLFLSWICIYLFNQYFAPPKEDSEDFYNNFKHNFWLKVMICFRIGPVSAMT
jgi:hypothetical protein